MMIKTILSVTFASLLTFAMSGCSKDVEVAKSVEEFGCKQEGVKAPQWTCIPESEKYYAGVGIAEKSAAGMDHMRRVAMANGRSDLAQQIETVVKDKISLYTGTTGVAATETVDKTAESVTKQVAKVNLNDSKAVDMWTAPSGAIYMLVTVSKNEANKQIRDNIKTSFNNDNALWQQFKAKNALEELEKEFEEK